MAVCLSVSMCCVSAIVCMRVWVHASVHEMRVYPLRCSDTHYPSPPLFSTALGAIHYTRNRQLATNVYVCAHAWVCV